MTDTTKEICRNCGNTLIKRQTKRKPSQLTQPYYYTAYFLCPHCGKMYHNDKFKVINENFNLFTQDVLSPAVVDTEIWTDGACSYNGYANARAAWAFVSGNYEESGLVEGKQTNNTAEAYAIYYALLWAAKKGHKHVRIHSDSQISINNLQKPLASIKENRELFAKIYDVINKNGLTVSYQKVAGHSGDINNERADKLANGLVGIK